MDIQYIEERVKQYHAGESSGHDFMHLRRVRHTATQICAHYPEADLEIVTCAALMHDVADHKIISEDKKSQTLIMMEAWLAEAGMDSSRREEVLHICQNISFSNREENAPLSLEGQIVQDADRIDAIGAVGIARCFAYGGSKHRPMYSPDSEGNDSISHFYEKLLHIKDLMNTPYGAELAAQRHQYIEEFLRQFYTECGEQK